MHAIVIGGGPAGLAASLALADLGHTVDILEKHPAFDVRGSTLGLAPNGSKALREFCPKSSDLDGLLKSGLPLPTGGSMLAWWMLRDWLLDQVKENDRIKIHMGVTLRSIDDTSDDSIAVVHCSEGDFQGQLVVAADGVHSQVRTLLGLSPAERTGKYVWRGGALAGGPPLKELLESGFTPIGYKAFNNSSSFTLFNHHPAMPKQLNWVCTSSEPTVVPGETTPWDVIEPFADGDAHRDAMKAILDKSDPRDLVYCTELSTVPLSSREPDQEGWGGRGRVTIVGDAAHAIRPASGQGTALAFEDCAMLRRKCIEFADDLDGTRGGCEAMIPPSRTSALNGCIRSGRKSGRSPSNFIAGRK